MLTHCLNESRLICPSCRRVVDDAYLDSPLSLDPSTTHRFNRPWHGLLICTGCQRRYPLIDGVPILFSKPLEWLKQQERAVFDRVDLPHSLGHFLRSAWSDSEGRNWNRQMLSIYGSTLSPPPKSQSPFVTHLHQQITDSSAFLSARRNTYLSPNDHVLDVGCAVGQASLSMATAGARVIALDHDFSSLRLLSHLVARSPLPLSRWAHGGSDYREETHDPIPSDLAILPLAADALNPPFRSNSFDLVTAYNVIDNVSDPVLLLRQLHAVLKPGRPLISSSPYDWVSRCTAPEKRLGEHIRLWDTGEPDPAQAIKDLLTGKLPQHAPEIRMSIAHEILELPWVLRRNNRSYHVFLTHYLEAIKAISSAI